MAVSQSLSVTQVSQNTANNTSQVRILWTSTQSGDSHNDNQRTAYYYVSINGGAETEYSVGYTLPKGSTTTILDKTITVTHKNDGTGSVKVRTLMDTRISAGEVEKSQSLNLTTISIASAPTVSASSVVMGDDITITTNRKNSSYTHNLTYKIGSSTGTIKNGVGAAHTWTVPLDFAKSIPSEKKGTVTITCKTFDKNGNSIGTKTVSFTATVPNNSTTKPSITGISTVPVHTLADKFKDVFIQGKSKVKVTTTATSLYSTIASYKTEILGSTGTTQTYTSGVLNTWGNVGIKVTVTDARGYSTTNTIYIEVIPYSKPKIIKGEGQNKIICARGNENGSINTSGTCLVIKVGKSYSSVMSLNFCSLKCEYKESEANTYTTVELISKSATADYVSKITTGFETTKVYNIKLIAEDDIGENDTVTITLPTVFATYHVPKGGRGFALGGYYASQNKDVFECNFNAEFGANVSGRVIGIGALPQISSGANMDDYKQPGVYAITSNAIATGIINLPVAKAGTIRVWAANGELTTNEANNGYIIQEYIPYDNTTSHRRSVKKTNGTWTYDQWKSLTWQ